MRLRMNNIIIFDPELWAKYTKRFHIWDGKKWIEVDPFDIPVGVSVIKVTNEERERVKFDPPWSKPTLKDA
jgi:hypothetical protein